MSHEEVCKRRFGPGFPAPCVHPETVECALWECQSRNRCKDSFGAQRLNPVAEVELDNFANRPLR